MAREGHGDRTAQPKPLSEILREADLVDEPGPRSYYDEAANITDEQWQAAAGEAQPTYAVQTDPNIDPAVRLECARMAAGSFGAAGCFDNELLLRRAEAIFDYIKNGVE